MQHPDTLVGARQTWLRTFHARPAATVRLVCFAHTCGSASFYRTWSKDLPPAVETVAVQYPGHEDRLDEDLCDDLHAVADAVVDELIATADRPLALFGHSLGAAVAYEVAQRLERRADIDLVGLHVSGRRAPRVRAHARDNADAVANPNDWTDDELRAALERWGGTNRALLSHTELARVFFPILRNDIRMSEAYVATMESKLACDVFSYVGDSDVDVPAKTAEAWRDITTGRFEFRTLAGGHFYVVPRRRELLRHLAAHLERDI